MPWPKTHDVFADERFAVQDEGDRGLRFGRNTASWGARPAGTGRSSSTAARKADSWGSNTKTKAPCQWLETSGSTSTTRPTAA